MHLSIKKDEAIKLRKEGNSYAFISSKILVSKSTLSEWLKGVPFMPNEMVKENILENNRRIANISRVDKAVSVKKASDYALTHVDNLTDRDIFVFGLGIYLGEGSKTGNQIRVVNSDPRIIKFSMVWFKRCFGVTDANFHLRLHLYPDNDENRVIRFWMRALGLKKLAFQSTYIDTRLDKRKDRKGRLPYGTAHLSVVSNGEKDFGVLLQRKIIASIDLALEKTARD